MMDDARKQRKWKGLYPASLPVGLSRLLLRTGVTLSAVAVLSGVSFSITQADDPPPSVMTVGYQNGTITAIHEKTLDIDGRTYGVTPDIVMLDEHGDILPPGRLMVSAEVKFHVKKEQSNMIEKMIVKLPR